MNTYQPYFYIIKHIKTGKYYAGSRHAKGCHPQELLKVGGYNTSSKYVNDIIDMEGMDSFLVERIRTFNTAEEAVSYETRFLKRVNARSNEMFINRCNNESSMSFSSEYVRDVFIDRYGTTCALQVPEFLRKAQKSTYDRFGVYHAAQDPGVQKKMQDSCLKNLGVRYSMQSPVVREKARQTFLQNYGVDNFSKTKEFSEMMLGQGNPRAIGRYKTPLGIFESRAEVDKAFQGIARGQTICNWCKRSDSLITRHVYYASAYMQSLGDESIINRTYKELGFELLCKS